MLKDSADAWMKEGKAMRCKDPCTNIAIIMKDCTSQKMDMELLIDQKVTFFINLSSPHCIYKYISVWYM